MIHLIDDDDIQNLINTRVIGIVDGGIEVVSFTSAEIALEGLRKKEELPRLIFLDINMPKMNGWDFLEVYQKENRTVKVYMLSSSINNKDIEKSKQYSIVQGFISKPLVVEKLAEILANEGVTS